MKAAERVLLWLAVAFLIYQNSNILTEDQVSDIATDVFSDVFSDKECVTKGKLEESVSKLDERIWSLEYDCDNK